MFRRQKKMQGFQAVFLLFLAFLIGVNCVNLKNTASSENQIKSGTNDICAQYCGRDPSIMCVGDLTTPENMTCSCKDATESYDKETNQCLARCIVKCGTYSGVTCGGDQSSDETTTCSCTDKTKVFSNGICITRCTAKCGLSRCTGEQTSDDTTICNCYPTYFYDEESGECTSRCEVKCGFGPYTTCKGDRNSDETTICGCSLEKLIFDEKSKTCTKRCTKKCGWDSNIKCGGDQRTDETTICGCRDSNRVYDENNKTCKVKCDCENGICQTNENGIAICKCLPEYGLVSDLRCKECGCGKGANCTFESSSEKKKCICREGYSDVNGICKGDCSHTPCKNGGACRIVDDNMICDCIPPFMGEYCEEDRCIQKCGRDPGVVCTGDLTSNESITCSCKDETKTYDEKSQQCVDRCIQKCGKDSSIICSGDLTSDENITCSCREENEIYDKRSYQCLDRCTVKCGTDSGVTCQGDQSSDETTICTCTNNTYVFAYKSCYTRCQMKCGVAWCTGDQTSDNTTICNCYSRYFYDKKSGKCEEGCKVKCGYGPYVTCKGDEKSDETTICGCGSSNLIFDEKNKTCIKRCINKCGWDSNIKCGGDQKTDETTICGCRDSSLVYVQEIQACKTKCSCVNGICYKDENDTAICNCLPEYGLVSSLRCRECKCGKGANCTFESSSQRKKCICGDGYSEVNGFCKADDPCVPNPCQHDGQCKNHNGKAKCHCIQGYTGALCETVNPCAPNPCKNGGLCISKKDTYKCVCERNNPDKDCSAALWCTLHGWSVCGSSATCHYNEVTGKHSCICPSNRVFDEKSKICKDICVPNPCAHGTCLRRMDTFVCKCSVSYRGVFCNETITDPCYPNPCQSGGSCIANGSKFTCACKSLYSGSTCEHGDKTVMTILLITLGIGVLIFASFGVFCWKRNQKLKQMSKSTGVYYAPPDVMLPDYPGNNIN